MEKEFADRVRCFNNMVYPLTWYFEFQKRVIDFLASQRDFEFIYRPAPLKGSSERVVREYIRQKDYKNIRIFDGYFLKALLAAERVIVDYPAGALFEAAVVGKSVLCICADYFRILKETREVFGKSFRQFSSVDEALLIINEFLNSEPNAYRVSIPLSAEGFTEVFGRIVLKEISEKNHYVYKKDHFLSYR